MNKLTQNAAILRKSYKRFVLWFIAIIISIFVLFIIGTWLWQKYDMWRRQKAVQNLAEAFKRAEQEDYQKAMADTYGGKTPQETLQMYIDAVEKGDYELASKYFIGDNQEEWKSELNEIKKVDKINIFLNPLKEVLKNNGEYSENKNTFSFHNPVFVSFKKYPNGIWKIIEI